MAEDAETSNHETTNAPRSRRLSPRRRCFDVDPRHLVSVPAMTDDFTSCVVYKLGLMLLEQYAFDGSPRRILSATHPTGSSNAHSVRGDIVLLVESPTACQELGTLPGFATSSEWLEQRYLGSSMNVADDDSKRLNRDLDIGCCLH